MKVNILGNKILLLSCLAPLVLTAIQDDQLNLENPKEKEHFKAATYEHLPILALPVCYETGKT